MNKRTNQEGFTLVELSIVLIIIGLIVGGVLAGQSLITSARLQSEVTKFNQLDTAINAFKLRNGGLPGDTKNVGVFTTAGIATSGGNGDEQIGSSVLTFKSTESAVAAAQLIELGLIQGVPVDPTSNGTNALSNSSTGGNLIPAKLADGIVLYGDANGNYARYSVQTTGAAGAVAVAASFTPEQVLSIDTKLDDGIATKGIVQSRGTTDLGTPGTSAAPPVAGTDCNATAGTGGAYAAGTTKVCGFAIRLSQ